MRTRFTHAGSAPESPSAPSLNPTATVDVDDFVFAANNYLVGIYSDASARVIGRLIIVRRSLDG